jgi:PQQ-like domain
MNVRAGVAVAVIVALASAVSATPAFAGQSAGSGAASPARSQLASPTRLWLTRQNGPHGAVDSAVAVSPDGSTAFTAGGLYRGTDKPAAVIYAYNASTGSQLWTTEYTTAVVSEFDSLVVSPDGSTLFAAGYSQLTGRSPRNYFIAAFSSATGTMLWQAGAGISGIAGSLAVAPNGSAVFVTGQNGTEAYNAGTGATLWTAPTADGTSIAVAPDGSAVYLASYALGTGGTNKGYLTTAESATTGATLWTSQYYVRDGGSTPTSIAADPDGSAVFITGTTPNTATRKTETTTVAYDPATGAQLWIRRIQKSGGTPRLAVSPDGSTVFAAGDSGGSTDPISYGEYFTAAYNAATGAVRWTAHYHGPATGAGSVSEGIAASPDGSQVFVTGYSWSAGASGQPQFATVAYNASTGASLWVARYGDVAKQASYGTAVAVSPDSSKVFVTGNTLPYATTIAYAG